MTSPNEEKEDIPAQISSSEEHATLPAYAQNFLPEVNLPLLILISSGHSPPLNPVPHLKFDVRSLPNPPKHIRDAYTGTSKRLQEWMRKDSRFLARRDAIRSEIEAAMSLKLDEHEKEDVLKLVPEDDETVNQTREQEPEDNEDLEENEVDGAEQGDNESATDESNQEILETSEDQVNLRVGIYCAMGRHRSVAMVEELSMMSWPGWEVKVIHRDVSKKCGGRRTASKRSGKKWNRGRGDSSYVEEG